MRLEQPVAAAKQLNKQVLQKVPVLALEFLLDTKKLSSQ